MSPSGDGPEGWVGATLGPHRLVQVLGVGGMAYVFLAERASQPPGEGRLAIKVLRPEQMGHEESRRRFEREARAAGRIRHPNVATVGQLEQLEEGSLFFPMELLLGLDLADTLLYAGRLRPARAVGIAGRVAAGLAAAHQVGVVHRDVKPENVFLVHAADGRELVKVIDFGFAWMDGDVADRKSSRITANLRAVGTPEYMAPEQVEGVQGHPVADVYSVGVLLFELLTGRVPYAGTSYAELADRHAQDPVPRAIEVAPNAGISDALDAVVYRALEKRPEDRYPSMFALVEALRTTPEGAPDPHVAP